MNNGFFDLFLTNERKKYNKYINLIEKKEYYNLFVYDNDDKFGLTSKKLYSNLVERMKKEVLSNPEILIAMDDCSYVDFYKFMEFALKVNPKIIEKFIDEKKSVSSDLILFALEKGYNPTDDFITNHFNYFSDVNVMLNLVDKGYFPSVENIEKNINVFSDPIIVNKLMDLGFVPSINFIEKANLFKDAELLDRILGIVEITPELVNSNAFLGNSLAQNKLLDLRPDILEVIPKSDALYRQILIELFKRGNISDEIIEDNAVRHDFSLFSRLIKQRPEMVKYCRFGSRTENDKIDDLALCMGYVPTINDVKNYEYVRKSPKLLKTLIFNRPEAIKYATDDGCLLNMSHDEFFDVVRLALDNGYIPTIEDLKNNPRLADSFDIMKILIQKEPELINQIKEITPNKEELLRIAIENGFNGEIKKYSKEDEIFGKSIGRINELLYSETAIKYQVDRGLEFESFGENYSSELYRYLIDKGYVLDEIIHLFSGNTQLMKEIISINPEYINKLSQNLSRKEIDELCFFAIDKGYVPKEEDIIFGCGSEIAKVMVKLYPSYLEKVSLLDRGSMFKSKPCDSYQDICKIATEGGYLPDIERIGSGYGYMTVSKYNFSYDIMKKAILIKPSLIEVCLVENKEKYDELCDLAIANGYEIEREFVLSSEGKKMRSNYNLMAKYIKNNPKFILDVEIDDPTEMLSLLNIAIDAGLNIHNLYDEELLKLFLKIDESKWRDYLYDTQINALRKAKDLKANNDEIAKTVNPDFLSDIIINNFSKSQIEILSCYPSLQQKIISLSLDSFKFRLVCELINKYSDNLEWVPILEKFLNNITSYEYSNLLMSIKGVELSVDEKEDLMYLLITNNHLDISSLDELKNIESIRERYINTLIERNTLSSLKTAYFEKVYGIDLSTAMDLVSLYGKSLEGNAIKLLDDNSRKEFILLENMKKIINLNNIDVLKYYVENINPSFIVKPDLMITYEARLKYLFTNEFNNSLTKPVAEDKVISDLVGEEDLDIYLAAGRSGKKKCRMMITSIGAYTDMSEPDDYYASWNVDKIASHGCCCSYIGEKNLGTAEVKYCCLGFTDYDLGSLQLSAPYDLCSSSNDDSYKIKAEYSSMFLLPDDVLGYTRHTHNETVWERRNISKDEMFKKQPSYIVYFVDNFEDRLTDLEAKRQWESVKKAANNFLIEVDGEKKPLPIMVVEREKIAKAQLEIINEHLVEFTDSGNPKLINEIISDYESNYAGNREYHLNISNKYFPKHEKLSNSVVGKIIEVINNLYQTNPNKALRCIYELENTIKAEQEKYNNTQHGVGQSLPSFNIEEALIECNRLKSKYKVGKDSTLLMINNCENKFRQFEKSDAINLDQELLNFQLSSNYVSNLLVESGLFNMIVKIENEITEENINVDLKVHGQRHVKNVLLYSALIGQSVIKDKNNLKLVLLAAKYHDIGRQTDGYEEHANASADIAVEKLKDSCSSEELAIIKTIIQFHEVSRNSFEDSMFEKIAKDNGISNDQVINVREMAEVLKDADALDRTRFINKARLNSKFLKYDMSKNMIRFASSLQETYAIQDLKDYNCDDMINILLQTYTPQEILRTLRHSLKGNVRNEDVQSFIEMWVNSSENKLGELQEMFEDVNINGEGVIYNGK